MDPNSTIVLAIIATSIATYISRFLGAMTSEKVSAESKIFQWFNLVAYSTLAALLGRIIVFPAGVLNQADLFIRLFVVLVSILLFYLSKKNLVYPTVLSAIILALMNGI